MISRPTNLSNNRVVVTGAGGFVGKHLVAALELSGADVTVFRGDILSADTDHIGNPDIVFHLAAFTDLSKCLKDPIRAFEINTIGTVKLLQACRNAKKFVYASTLGVYGEPVYLPLDEMHPTSPVEPYAASKLAGEAAVWGYCTAHGMPFAIGRFFNVYGPGQRKEFVIPRLVNDILKNEEVTIRNAGSTRDFIYVDDVVAGLLALGERAERNAYNIGTGIETSIQDLAALIAKFAKKHVSIIVQDEEGDAGHVTRSRADVRRAASELGWHSSISLEEGIKKLLS